ncbi:helix-turn-helix transcriptional regulator [Rahnella aquatilis]|uniref:helix-turn-helix transcriptional regulator n=1 Tax=Rahnella aquatilis TaxID=34038 RepID=UPI00364F1DE7
METVPGHERLANRIVNMLLQLFEKGSVSRHELAERFKVSERTVYRDLNRLGEYITCSKEGVYRISLPAEEKDPLPTISSVIEKTGISKLLPLENSRALNDVLRAIEYRRIEILPLPAEMLLSEHQKKTFSSLEHAIREGRRCQLQYKGKNRTLNPYRLMNVKGIWYLAATDEHQMIKAYLVSGIQWLDIKHDTFKPDPDISDYLNNEDDIWFSRNKIEVLVEVMPNVAHYFERRNILPQQKMIEKTADGKVRLSTMIAHEEQLFSILRFWLPNIRIITPLQQAENFVQQLKQYVELIQQA